MFECRQSFQSVSSACNKKIQFEEKQKKMQFFAFCLCSALVTLAAATQSEETTPETVELHPPIGRVRGSFMKSRMGKNIYSFRGLRFAEPPVGELRFQPPVPVAPWKDVFDATQEGPGCPQVGGQIQSEDCLRLNVYTTKLPSVTKKGKPKNPKRPVIIYFHPGAFYVFTGQSFMVGPEYIMDQDIVLVTVNNRLGILGWAATGDAVAPGNLGLKDQVVAMRWVQNNIDSFGGDPNSVTILGYSAGSWSVVLHLVSPMTKGLFHRAIAMSGSAINQKPLPYHQLDIAEKQAKLLDCPTNSSAVIIACLKTISAIKLGGMLEEFFIWRGQPGVIWSPVVEPYIPGVERYLTAQPLDLIRQGMFHSVPLITGNTRDEFASSAVSLIEEARNGGPVFQELNDNWEKYMPLIGGYEMDTSRSRKITKALKQMYFDDKPVSLKNVGGLENIWRDALAFQAHRLANVMGRYSKKPVYYYEFAYQGRYSYGAVWNDTKKPYGVSHHDDLLYLFYNNFFPYFEPDDPEIPMVKRLTSMWANFAKTSEPIPSSNAMFTNVTWTPFTARNKMYMENGDELIMKTDYRGERMRQWDQLFPIRAAANKVHY